MKKLGQLMMFGFEGTKVTPELKSFIKETNCGGVILFAKNIENPDQLKNLITDLQSASETSLVVAVDQEGGRVARLKEPFTKIPPMAEVAKMADAGTEIEKIGQTLAQELLSVGFNLDFAPVLDVATNPANPVIGDRSFSSDPNVVAELGSRLITAMQSAGLAACGKHFPGHGDTDVDSHLDLPIVNLSVERFESCEWIPFVRAIETKVASIMTAHILVPSVDGNNPATISEKFLTQILRNKLGFDGVIFTDDLTMKGIEKVRAIKDLAALSIQAGADIAMVCHEDAKKMDALNGLRDAVENGSVSEKRIKESLKRISEFKDKYC